MTLAIRQATTNDCALIQSLAARIWMPTYGHTHSQEQLDYMFEMMYSLEHIREQMEVKGHTYFIASADGEPCGYISIEKADDALYIFQKIYCLPSLQGQGVGRYLVEQGIKWVKAQHNHPTPLTIELYVNRLNRAVDFYEHLGFRKTATRDYPIGNNYFMNDYIMQLSLPATIQSH